MWGIHILHRIFDIGVNAGRVHWYRYKNICLVQKFEAKIKASSIAVYGWPLNIRRDIYPLVLVGSLAGL